MKMLTFVLSPYFLSIVKISSYFQTSSVCDYGAISGFRFRCLSPAQHWGRAKALGDPEKCCGCGQRCWPKSISVHVACNGALILTPSTPTALPWSWMPHPRSLSVYPHHHHQNHDSSPGPLLSKWLSPPHQNHDPSTEPVISEYLFPLRKNHDPSPGTWLS